MRCIILAVAILISGCGSTSYQGLPDLPEKDWLASKAENHEKNSENTNVEFYQHDKIHSFQDLVYLAIQSSPVISQGRINLEVQQISRRDALWKYLPEVHLLYTISNNITKYNESQIGKFDSSYGKTQYQVSFTGVFNNPVANYFNVQAQEELMQVAISTQRKAIGDCIQSIADILLTIDLKEKSVESLKKMLKSAEKMRDFALTKEEFQPDLNKPASQSEEIVQDIRLRLRTAEMELSLARSQLKLLVGIDVSKVLKVDPSGVYETLSTFIPQKYRWQDCWEQTEERYLLRQQVRLEEANVYLAWAQYVPNISMVLNENPPNGQSQAAGARTDQFFHLTFDFPLLDWGHRYRMAAMSGARKRQRMLDEIQRQREYGQRWVTLEQQLLLAQARAEQRKFAEQAAQKQADAMQIAFENGTVSLSDMLNAQQLANEKRLLAFQAEYDVAKAKLSWMYFSSELSRFFLGTVHGKANDAN